MWCNKKNRRIGHWFNFAAFSIHFQQENTTKKKVDNDNEKKIVCRNQNHYFPSGAASIASILQSNAIMYLSCVLQHLA